MNHLDICYKLKQIKKTATIKAAISKDRQPLKEERPMSKQYYDSYGNSRDKLISIIQYLRSIGLSWHQIAHIFWFKETIPRFTCYNLEFDFRRVV